MLLEHDLRIIQELAYYIWRKHISTHEIPNSSIHAPNQKWLKSRPWKMPKPENKSCNGSFWGAYRVSRSANEPPFHKHVKRSQHISIKRIMSQNGGTLFKWLGSYKWLQMTTNQFWGVSSFLCSESLKFSTPCWEVSRPNPPSHCAHPFQEIMCFFGVFAYWFLEIKSWFCWMSCFFSIYIYIYHIIYIYI